MPLFECSKCHMVDNTALTNFWASQLEAVPPLCSGCDEYCDGWHGLFDRMTAEEYNAKFPECPVDYRLNAEGLAVHRG